MVSSPLLFLGSFHQAQDWYAPCALIHLVGLNRGGLAFLSNDRDKEYQQRKNNRESEGIGKINFVSEIHKIRQVRIGNNR
jgi:hypothetical protein